MLPADSTKFVSNHTKGQVSPIPPQNSLSRYYYELVFSREETHIDPCLESFVLPVKNPLATEPSRDRAGSIPNLGDAFVCSIFPSVRIFSITSSLRVLPPPSQQKNFQKPCERVMCGERRTDVLNSFSSCDLEALSMTP
jgi:hypothetical protein